MHLGQRLAFEILAVGEQEARGACRPVVEIVAHRAVIHQVEHDPEAVVERAADDLHLAVRHRAQGGQVGLDGRVQDLPAFALVDERHRLDVLFGGMAHDIADIGLGVLRQQRRRAGRQIARQQGRGVAPAAVVHEEHLPTCRNRPGRWSGVLGGDRFPRLPVVAGRLDISSPPSGVMRIAPRRRNSSSIRKARSRRSARPASSRR